MAAIVTQMVIDGVVFVGQPIPWDQIRDKHFMVTHTWHDGASSKAAVSERPHGHGAYGLGDPYRESLLISVEGWSWGSTRAEWQRLRNQLMALGADNRVVLARLIDGGEDTWRWVQVVKITPKDDRATNRTHWTIDLRAADPRRYGPRIFPSGQAIPLVTGDVNRLPNPSFAVNAAGWWASVQGGGGAEFGLSRVAHGYDGWMGRYTTPIAVPGLAVGTRGHTAAGVRDVIVDVHSSTTTRLRLTLSWIGTSGAVIETWSGTQVDVLAGVPQRLSRVVDVVPMGAATLSAIVDGYDAPGGWPAGSSLGVHRALVGRTPDADVHDGDSPGWTWDGAVGASASRRSGAMWGLDNRAGTADSVPLLQFTPSAPLSGFRVSQSGHGSLQWSGQVIPAGTLVTVDTRGHQVLLDGRLPERRWSGEFPIVEAGETSVLTLSTPGVAASATCTWSPAWW